MAIKFANRARSTLASSIGAADTSLTVADGSSFPTLSGSDYFYATLASADGATVEVVKVTARATNTLTVTRAQESTAAAAWASGTTIEQRITATTLTDALDERLPLTGGTLTGALAANGGITTTTLTTTSGVTLDGAQAGDGGSTNSPVLTLRGYYDIDGTAGVANAAVTSTIQSVSNSGNAELVFSVTNVGTPFERLRLTPTTTIVSGALTANGNINSLNPNNTGGSEQTHMTFARGSGAGVSYTLTSVGGGGQNITALRLKQAGTTVVEFVPGSTTTFTGAVSVTGNTTLGDASGDSVTINGATITASNATTTLLGASSALGPGTHRLQVGSASVIGSSILAGSSSGHLLLYAASDGHAYIGVSDTSGGRNLYIGKGPVSGASFTAYGQFDGSGNFGLGGAPINYGAGYVTFDQQASSAAVYDMRIGGARVGTWVTTSTYSEIGTRTAVPLIFSPNSNEAARIDISGNLGISVSPAAWTGSYKALQVHNGAWWASNSGTSSFWTTNTYFDGTDYRAIGAGTGCGISQSYTGEITFYRLSSASAGAIQTQTNVAKIDSSGNLLAGAMSPIGIGGVPGTHSFQSEGGTSWNFALQHTHASAPYGLAIRYSAASPNSAGSQFIYCNDSPGTLRFSVGSHGGISNYSANNVNLSDEREKDNIRPFDPAAVLDAYLAIPLFDYWYRDQSHEDDNLGTVAQRLYDSHPYNRRFVDIDSWRKSVLGADGEPLIGEDGKPVTEARMAVYDGDLHYFTMAMTQHAHVRLNDNDVQRERLIAALETYHPDIREKLAAL